MRKQTDKQTTAQACGLFKIACSVVAADATLRPYATLRRAGHSFGELRGEEVDLSRCGCECCELGRNSSTELQPHVRRRQELHRWQRILCSMQENTKQPQRRSAAAPVQRCRGAEFGASGARALDAIRLGARVFNTRVGGWREGKHRGWRQATALANLLHRAGGLSKGGAGRQDRNEIVVLLAVCYLELEAALALVSDQEASDVHGRASGHRTFGRTDGLPPLVHLGSF